MTSFLYTLHRWVFPSCQSSRFIFTSSEHKYATHAVNFHVNLNVFDVIIEIH